MSAAYPDPGKYALAFSTSTESAAMEALSITPDDVAVATVSPAAKVFRVTELLEQILMNTSQTDVIVAQRVDRTFKHVIQGSKTLQRKMFGSVQTEPRLYQTYTTEGKQHTHHFTRRCPKVELLRTNSKGQLRRSRRDWERLHLHGSSQASHEKSICLDITLLGKLAHPLGWQGKRWVHTTGSWRKLPIDEKIAYRVEEVWDFDHEQLVDETDSEKHLDMKFSEQDFGSVTMKYEFDEREQRVHLLNGRTMADGMNDYRRQQIVLVKARLFAREKQRQ